jgi:hypothetical protein
VEIEMRNTVIVVFGFAVLGLIMAIASFVVLHFFDGYNAQDCAKFGALVFAVVWLGCLALTYASRRRR